MEYNGQDVLEVLQNSKEVLETLTKIFYGYYVTDKERKDSMKSFIDNIAKDAKTKATTEQDIEVINNQANFLKLFVDCMKERNI